MKQKLLYRISNSALARQLVCSVRIIRGLFCQAVARNVAVKTYGAFVSFLLLTIIESCQVEPPLHLYRGISIITDPPEVRMNVDVMWKYDFDIDWKVEWQYGWDSIDIYYFGPLEYRKPTEFELRRYYLKYEPLASHSMVEGFHLKDSTFTASYNFGYYDMLVWNTIITDDGIQSIYIDESNLDNVTAETHRSMNVVTQRSSNSLLEKVSGYTYWQPEDFFQLYIPTIYISDDPKDYDYYDEERKVYYMKIKGTLQPVVYIYLPQLILYNNKGRITSVDGNSTITGMARRTSVNTGITEDEAVNVYFNNRMKKGITLTAGARKGEVVDIIGGKVNTFGICNTNPYTLSRAIVLDDKEHYVSFNVQFNNGIDSTFVFDVTQKVRDHYRGGVITLELDVDTVKIPQKPSGSGFDATVEDFEEESHEFDM